VTYRRDDCIVLLHSVSARAEQQSGQSQDLKCSVVELEFINLHSALVLDLVVRLSQD
jgi:hypothetical protein